MQWRLSINPVCIKSLPAWCKALDQDVPNNSWCDTGCMGSILAD